jgi:hypothetical protein
LVERLDRFRDLELVGNNPGEKGRNYFALLSKFVEERV